MDDATSAADLPGRAADRAPDPTAPAPAPASEVASPAASAPPSTPGSTPDLAPVDGAPPADDQPRVQVTRGGVRYTLLGTAHVSRRSAEAVEHEIKEGSYHAVAIELDPGRHAALTDPDRYQKLDLFQVLRRGRAGALAANLALGAFQQRLADQIGIEPGAEMRAAIRAADARELPLWLVDRDIGTTLRRVYRNVPWWQRLTLFGGLVASVISSDEITEEEIEKLKEGDILEATFTEFSERSARLYEPLIAERDAYMAARLEQESAGAARPADGPLEVLVVIGAGHLKGLRAHLEALPGGDEDAGEDEDAGGDVAAPAREPAAQRLAALDATPPPSRLRRALPWLIVALIVAGFVIGFARNPELGVSLLGDWFLINGTLAALGAAIALAHPLTILGSFVAAPITSLNPTIGAGFVAAGLELWLRKPTVGDFERLRADVTQARGWWRNRVARTLLVFVLATIGSALGTYLGGARIFGRLLG